MNNFLPEYTVWNPINVSDLMVNSSLLSLYKQTEKEDTSPHLKPA